MNLNINQTKLIGLTMELDLKTREYKSLCEKLDKLKENNIDENDEILIDLKREFEQNYAQITQINKQIRELKSIQSKEERKKEEKYDVNEIFKQRKQNNNEPQNVNKELKVLEKDNIFKKLFERIKKIIKK